MKKAFTTYLTHLLLLSGLITAPLLHAGAAAGDCGIEFFNSGYIQTPDFHKLGITGEVTVEFWAKTAGPAGHFVFRLFPDDPANRFAASINYGGADTTYWDFGDIGGNGRLAQANPFPTAGKWVHYAMVSSKSGNFMRYYMNGELIAQQAVALEFFPNFNDSAGYALRIGPEMIGAMDEFRLWRGVRTQAAIRADMYRTLTGSESGLRLYYKFEEPTIGTVVNSAKATGTAYDGAYVSGSGPAAEHLTNRVGDFTVLNTNDAGPGSLRQALANAIAQATGPKRITFSPALNGRTLNLGSSFVITGFTEGLTIDASTLPLGVTLAAAPAFDGIIFDHRAGSRLNLTRLSLTGASATAIINKGALTLKECTLRSNQSQFDGGAITNSDGGQLDISDCTFALNRASTHGGAVNLANSSTAKFTRCTFSGNTSSFDGGAIEISGNSNVQFQHCTFANNTCGRDGGAIDHFTATTTVTLAQCLFAQNTAGQRGLDIYVPGSASAVICNGTNILSQAPTVTTGVSVSIASVVMSPLADNGGPTQTQAFLSNEPLHAAFSAATRDQRGLPIQAVPDVGAYESQEGAVFSFSEPSYNQPEGNIAVATIYRSTQLLGSYSVTVKTNPGTASAADFTGTTQTLTFDEGVFSRTINIPTLTDSLAEANETFTLTLSAPSAGAKLGSLTTTTIVIRDPSATAPGQDTTPPAAPVIISPAANATVNVDDDGLLTITGTASDNKVVAGVTILDRTPTFIIPPPAPPAPVNALRIPVPAAQQQWTAKVPVTSGLFTFQASSGDAANLSTESALRTVKILRPLKVNIRGDGEVNPGFAPKSFREVGRPYTLTAKPRTGALFGGWSILSNHTASDISASNFSSPTFNFIHRQGLVLRANFVPSPFVSALNIFTANTSTVTTFTGLVFPSLFSPDRAPLGSNAGEDGTAPSISTLGGISITTQSSGSYTGALKLDGTSYPLKGAFDSTLKGGLLTVPRPGKSSLFVEFDLRNVGSLFPQIEGYVAEFGPQGPVAVSGFTAPASGFSKANPFPAPIQGAYTGLVITPPGVPNADYPNGDGFISMKINSLGVLSGAGKLADGSPLTFSAPLDSNARWSLYAPLYNRTGVIVAAVNGAGAAPLFTFTGQSTWLRPVTDSQHYPSGWPNGIDISISASQYRPAPGSSALGALSAIDGNGNATLQWTNGRLTSPKTGTVGITTADRTSNLPADPSFTFTLNRSTGIFSGTFLHSDGTRPKYEGIILRTTNPIHTAAGFFLSTTPSIKDYLGRGGRITITPQP